jgi:hypothetical protein
MDAGAPACRSGRRGRRREVKVVAGRDWRSGGAPPWSGPLGLLPGASRAPGRATDAALRSTLVNSPVTANSAAVAYAAAMDVITAAEPDVAAAIAGELASQRRQLKLIASENYASPAVLLAMGNWLSDKYAEGTVGRRLYAGCEMVDRVESIAAGHARALFGADHAYVQPHSGIDANLVAFRRVRAVRRQGLPDGARRPAAPCHGGQGDRVRRGPAAVVRRLRVRGGGQRPDR